LQAFDHRDQLIDGAVHAAEANGQPP
jgi:hypothetical protein